ncbi:MAG: glycosyltransferase family 9 protein, partial [Desulfohalobiaceae bacterium]|nr:glycosyltransferase family 9 protein [Desulfohalobiaceae bacterium]
ERLSSEAGPLPKIEQYQQFMDALGLDRIRPLDFGLQGLTERTAGGGEKNAPLKTPYVALVLGSSWESKEWFFESYLQLMRRLLSLDNLQLVLLDAPGKKQQALGLTDILGSKRISNLVGRTTLPELAGVLQGAELAIGPDCGSGHLAAAVGTAYISLFGPTAADRTAPFGCLPLVCEAALDCRPCYRRRCPRFDKGCMRAIDPEAVFALACRLLGRPA